MTYRKISVSIWNDDRFMALSHLAKLVWLFLLTHPALTSFGALRATPQGLACELGLTPLKMRRALKELAPLAIVHPKLPLIYCKNYLAHNPAENPNVVKSWIHGFEKLPECPLRDEILADLSAHAKARGEAFLKAFNAAFAPYLKKTVQLRQGKLPVMEAPRPSAMVYLADAGLVPAQAFSDSKMSAPEKFLAAAGLFSSDSDPIFPKTDQKLDQISRAPGREAPPAADPAPKSPGTVPETRNHNQNQIIDQDPESCAWACDPAAAHESAAWESSAADGSSSAWPDSSSSPDSSSAWDPIPESIKALGRLANLKIPEVSYTLQASDRPYIIPKSLLDQFSALYPEITDWPSLIRDMAARLMMNPNKRPESSKMPAWINYFIRNVRDDLAKGRLASQAAIQRDAKAAQALINLCRIPMEA